MMSLLSFSQVDTSKVLIDKQVLKEAAKDLARYDALKEINKSKDSIIFQKNFIILQKTKTIEDQKTQLSNLASALSLEQSKNEVKSGIIDTLKKDNKKQKRQVNFFKGTSGVLVIVVLVLLI